MAETEALTFEKVWAMFQETDRKFQETDRQFKETDRQFKETDRQFKETDRKFQETREQIKDTDRHFMESKERIDQALEKMSQKVKETTEQMGKLNNNFGELAEHLVAPNIMEKFNLLGFSFEQISQNHVIKNASKQCIAEIDILLENGDTVMAVEVKAKPTQKDVKDHINRMEKMRIYADLRGDKRKLLGAIAAVIAPSNEKKYALEQGFFVIEPSGDTFNITPPPYQPKEW